MFGAVVRAAGGFVFGMLVGGVLNEIVTAVRPFMVAGLSESHEIVRYLDAINEYWPLVVLLGALMGVLSAGIAESSGRKTRY
jgi:hypothetical protein